MIKIKGMILATTLLAAATAATAQQTYRELIETASLNRGVYGLRSMQDGEHYTAREGNAIVRHSYADASQQNTLYTGTFSSYTLSPDETTLLLSSNHRPVYRHSFYADWQIVPLEGDGTARRITLMITAEEDVYFHFGQQIATGATHADCQFYLPGFWYRRNLRSPENAPSFRVADSWEVREDRLSTPLSAIFDDKNDKVYAVARLLDAPADALTTHREGEVILSGNTSVGFTGFVNREGQATLSFGFPYRETPKSYLRKLTLGEAVEAFQHLKKGESRILRWEVSERGAADYAACVEGLWEYSFDLYQPTPYANPYPDEQMKETLSHFFTESYVDDASVKYYSGVELETANCRSNTIAEVGFVGRTLLNAFNALEYGESQGKTAMVAEARTIFDSYQQNGFSSAGFFLERMNARTREMQEPYYSIRRQSEGIYAVLYYLNYERQRGRKHPEWEARIKAMFDEILKLQKADGSFPRKFRDDLSLVDSTGGSTPSATLPLVMGYKYFKDKRYLEAAKRSVDYVEKEIVSKSDYFSSTLDANCEDKEASLYATTAAYYLSLVCKGEERKHYLEVARKAAYFALSWYYVWDVPFAPGQMLGDIGLKTRGWGNVSVENNHIDVFVFDFADVLQGLARESGETRFADFAEVICTSMRQLLPFEGHLCGIAKKGYYPEVVQHTWWDYGKNGKGYYNNIFAPGWVVASLWELLSPGRAEAFLTSDR